MRKRKERESNPQGSSLVRVRAGCRRLSACPSSSSSSGGRNRTRVLPVNSRALVPARTPPELIQSGRPDSNRRSPAPEAGGLRGLSHAPSRPSAQRESNPHFRHGKAAGCRYIMGTLHRHRIVKEIERAPGGTRTHVAALRVRCPCRWTTSAWLKRPQWDPRDSNPHLPG